MKILALFFTLLMLFGCAPAEPVFNEIPEQEIIEKPEPQILEPEEIPKPEKIQYIIPGQKNPEAAITNYFHVLYDSYISMLPADISPLIDKNFEMMSNVQNWSNLLAMRRRIIFENNYCYVETQRFPYTITYITKRELDDQRMDYVDMKDFGEGAVAIHFVVEGIDGKAYPPIFALNSQHTAILTFENGVYKIAYHYFPGSEGKFQNDLPVNPMERKEMEKLLEKEFGSSEEPAFAEPEFERIYNGEAAAEYALSFCEEHNPEFHFVGDWYGNCMNFASQCIWSGFRNEGETAKYHEGMTKAWYCGKSGGTLEWSSVSRFWKWANSEKTDMQILVFNKTDAVKTGDIVHIGSYACEEEGKFTHALLVVESEKLLLAQNSPACFVYYSDLVNNYARFIRPVSLDA
ncbi:MAG: amidase domain-containing protein [Oscillospiraceae bacterium]|nr:amidase domain-containing protein [Oscillospiraceae bacterium]